MSIVTLLAVPRGMGTSVLDRQTGTRLELGVPAVVEDPGIEARLDSLKARGYSFGYGPHTDTPDPPAVPASAPGPVVGADPVPAAAVAVSP
jgi:hypothetical protein